MARLFAGRAVLHVEHFAAPEQGVFRFHNWLSLFRDTSPVSTAIVNARCGEVSASSSQFRRIVLSFTA
jgi:hypothetical protein